MSFSITLVLFVRFNEQRQKTGSAKWDWRNQSNFRSIFMTIWKTNRTSSRFFVNFTTTKAKFWHSPQIPHPQTPVDRLILALNNSFRVILLTSEHADFLHQCPNCWLHPQFCLVYCDFHQSFLFFLFIFVVILLLFFVYDSLSAVFERGLPTCWLLHINHILRYYCIDNMDKLFAVSNYLSG